MIRCGPAGWDYGDWAGIVYPEPRPKGFDSLGFIARYFDTVEVNSTFYGPQPARVADGWARRVSHNPEFRFTAKLWRRFTHQRSSAWTAAEVAEARATPEALGEAGRFGALLVQFPWSFRRTEENREWLRDIVSTFGDLPLAVEVRHESWNDPAFFADLAEQGVCFVNIDQPQYSDSIGPSARATAPVGYVRVHGRNYRDWWRHDKPHERYDYLYSAEELEPWAGRAREVDADETTRETYVVTNNHYQGKAVANALMLRSMLSGSSVDAPPPLLDHYAELLGGFVHAAG